jgi:hypothetical protein
MNGSDVDAPGAAEETMEREVAHGHFPELVWNGAAVLNTLLHEIRVDAELAGEALRDRWRHFEARLREE